MWMKQMKWLLIIFSFRDESRTIWKYAINGGNHVGSQPAAAVGRLFSLDIKILNLFVSANQFTGGAPGPQQ